MELTRRDVLASFLGAAVACRARTKAEPPPPGLLAGASHQVGHRLRDAINATPARWEEHDVAIVGSGIAGLSAAWQLARRDVRDVIVLELEPSIGGTSRSGVTHVSAHPWGAHYVPLPSAENTTLRTLLGEMGVMDGDVPAEQFLCRDPEERIFVRGRWYEGLYLYAGASYDDLRQLRAFEAEVAKWVSWRDGKGRRAFAVPMAHGSDDAEVTGLDRMSMADWLDARGLHSERLRWLIDYGCRDDYGLRLADTSAWAGLFYFASRVEAAGEESRAFVTFPEGNGRFVAHLSKNIDIRPRWLVANVSPREEGADLVVVRDHEAIGIRAKRVIFAAPRFLAPYVIQAYPKVEEFTYGSWMVANLTLRERPASEGFPLAWDNVLYDSPSLGYVVATHQTGRDHGPTVFTYYYPLVDGDPRVARERLLSLGRDEWADVALTDLQRAHPDIRKITERIDIMRWGHAMIRPTPGFIWSPARRRAHEPYRTIHFANTDISGIALFEEALDHGVRAGDEVANLLLGRPAR
ncbi:MAG TPA: FAD-dependent oxidoreductase [Thermoanaerobaculia bacterium]